ncbi:MAG TPA: hypothetical protein VHH11_11660 [Gammaproteobacteria bacterium]|jgi:hypothetical protein|nr:hypothetical protein [Gammaproteobacteria bacterium]
MATVLFARCDGSDGLRLVRGDTLVYVDRGAHQCQSDGLSPEASAQRLIDAGVDVLKSYCGQRTGVVFPTVCGAPTGDILLHEIRAANLPDAERLGFQNVAALAAAGQGYVLVDCTTRRPLP